MSDHRYLERELRYFIIMSGTTENENNLTPEEREQWLKDHGIQVETPSDRRQAESILSGCGTTKERPPSIVDQVQNLSISSSDNVEEGIRFVYIPHDTSKPLSTLTLPKRLVDALGPSGDIIPTYVKSFFADGLEIDDSLFNEQLSKQNLMGGDLDKFASAATDNKTTPSMDKLTSTALKSVTTSGSVETFPLVRPSSTNNNQGVYIYLDEVGLLKKLRNNTRASALAQQCGYHPAPNFYGDIFVARVSSKNYLHNIDIKKEEVTDKTQEWMLRAPQENIAWQQALNEATGRQGEIQQNHAGTEGVAVQVEGFDEDDKCSYSWLQNEEEVEITISLTKKINDEGGTNKKVNKSLIKVSFLAQKITVKYGGESILEVIPYSKLDVDGSTWTLDNANLVITCEKASEGEIWPRLELSS